MLKEKTTSQILPLATETEDKLEEQPFILPKFEFSLVHRGLAVTYRHSILLLYHLIERLVFIVSASGTNIQDVSY